MAMETGSQKTQFKKVSELKARIAKGERPYMQIGQYFDFGNDNLSRLLHKEGTDTFLHGENVDQRFLDAHEAKRKRIIIPTEPQQSKMILENTATRHLEAISRILASEVESRRAKESKVG